MAFLERDGVRIAYDEAGRDEAEFVFVHGWMCDRSHFALQMERFSRIGRCVAVDLPGHGASDKPEGQDYSIAGFASDLHWLCGELGLRRPIMVGHSMGGVGAYRLAADHPELPRAIVALDCPIAMTAKHHEALTRVAQRFHGPDYEDQVRRFVGNMFLPTDDQERKEMILATMLSGPKHVGVPAFDGFLNDPVSQAEAAPRIEVPLLAIAGSGGHMSDIGRVRELTPLLVTAQAVGTGHFLQLEVPEQVNAMIERFLVLLES